MSGADPKLSTVGDISCPYLDTINRTLLDFDFEHSCSISLESSPHIYACLVCGKFFRGKGKRTPAYTHAVDEGHFVYVHLLKGTFHCLPEDYEIRNEPSLNDISRALHPKFSRDEVKLLDKNQELARDLFGRRYLPGFVGLNNLNKTDYLNAVVQALAHVRPLRDYFLLVGSDLANGKGNEGYIGKKENDKSRKRKHSRSLHPSEFSHLAKCFSLLLRNMWSSHRFKSNVDPHMLVQAVSVASNKRYHVGKQAEAGEFLAWLLHQLHIGVGGTKKRGSTVVHDAFMGKVEVTTLIRRRRRRGEEKAFDLMKERNSMETSEEKESAFPSGYRDNIFGDDDDRAGSDDEETVERKRQKRETLKTLANERIIVEEESTMETNFLQLTLDIPEKPLFKAEDGGLVIPQEPLVNVLRKFDGVSFCDALALQQQDQQVEENGIVVTKKRRYRLKKLPNYLILHLSRFKRNNFSVEKNPTIVMFPVKNFDLSSYVFPEGGREKVPTEEEVRQMSIKELKKLLSKYGRGELAQNSLEKDELLQHCLDFITTSLPDLLADKYDLVANITHDIPAEVGREGQRNPLEEGSYRCHVQHKASGQWYEIHDLHVQETMPQLIGVSESYLLIFERKSAQP